MMIEVMLLLVIVLSSGGTAAAPAPVDQAPVDLK